MFGTILFTFRLLLRISCALHAEESRRTDDLDECTNPVYAMRSCVLFSLSLGAFVSKVALSLPHLSRSFIFFIEVKVRSGTAQRVNNDVLPSRFIHHECFDEDGFAAMQFDSASSLRCGNLYLSRTNKDWYSLFTFFLACGRRVSYFTRALMSPSALSVK
ncbi:hypothetical protein GALMADRAFT_719530 [Galerina marginata CBS 339.88]|uniref:Secreted protein n=1 Tax=Galerina marginata (strain CBS 339.88) TaxID=685588 RepID=A0A067TXB6_GALM3|nr:hypothetical protein GALMADRAFT_719530 [Galerina marginata CBS 339.88]